jgi:ribonuclease BN (tRNA processing enzyme)
VARAVGLVLFAVLFVDVVPSSLDAQETPRTRVVLLGTGTPNADPARSGPATAIVVDDRAYLFDAGPGVVRRAAQAARDHGIPALAPTGLQRVFLTHLHSDHTIGLPDVLLSPWVLDRVEGLEVWGPPGTREMMDGIQRAWRADIDIRLNGLEPRDANPDGWRATAHDVGPGLVYEDDLVRIHAIQVVHGSFEQPLGYRIEGPDRTIVISGDAAPSESIIEACSGCDVLVHEVYSAERFVTRPPEWQRYHSSFHTSTVELAELARRARPRLLVLYHQLFWGSDDNGAPAGPPGPAPPVRPRSAVRGRTAQTPYDGHPARPPTARRPTRR